jgi:hypothetical protein
MDGRIGFDCETRLVHFSRDFISLFFFFFLLFINDIVGWNQKKSTRLILNIGHGIFFSGCFSLENCTLQLFLPGMDENIDTFGSLKDFLKGSL